MKKFVLIIFVFSTCFCLAQKANYEGNKLLNDDKKTPNNAQDSILKLKKLKQELQVAKLLKLQDSLLKALAIEIKIEAELAKNKLPRTEYYTVGQNGIELIGKLGAKRIVVSVYDANPLLKEEVAQTLLDLNIKKTLIDDGIIAITTAKAIVTGKCKIKADNKFTNIFFYFQKIQWKSGLTQIHQGDPFIATPSVESPVDSKIYTSKFSKLKTPKL